jgi:thiamine pyrophosphate-dependent acetolactate synthase large subunit-like protein
MKGHQAIAHTLSKLGVRTMFGVMGDSNLFFTDSFVRDHGGSFIAATHEANAVMMAKGYAVTSGRLGVATVTHGPGLTNTVTALVDAVRGNTPIVLIAGATSPTDPFNIQRIEQREIVRSTGAACDTVTSTGTLVSSLMRAAQRAIYESRPVVLIVPIDVQWEDVDVPAKIAPPIPRQETRPDPDVVDRALGLILNAARPLILAGAGATSPSARAAILELSAAVGAPVTTTLKAKDLFRGEPFDLGIFGTLSTDLASEVMAESDCVLAFGASLNRWTTSAGQLLQGKRIVQVDIDRARLGSRVPIDVGIEGSAGAVARTMCELLADSDLPPSRFRSPELAERIAALHAVPPPHPTSGPLSPSEVIGVLDQAISAPRTVAVDLGRAIFDAIRGMRIDQPCGFVWTADFGSIGLGMPAAIGGYLGSPDRPVLLLCGDGGFMMGGVSELSTAVSTGADLITVVFNDSAYGAEHVQFRDRGMDASMATSRWPDLAEVARAMGAAAVTVRERTDLAVASARISERKGPILVDVRLEPDHVPGVSH